MQNLKSEITAALVCSPSMNAMRGRWVILPGSTMDASRSKHSILATSA